MLILDKESTVNQDKDEDDMSEQHDEGGNDTTQM